MRHQTCELIPPRTCRHTEGIKRAVESGLGIGCISRLRVTLMHSNAASLVAIESPKLNLTRQFLFTWHKHKYQTDAMSEFLSLCRGLTENIQRSDQIDLATLV